MMNKQMLERLIALIGELDISYSSLSEKMGFSRTYIQQVIEGRVSQPSDKMLTYLEAVHNANLNWLIDGRGDMFLEGGKKYDDRIAKMLRQLQSLPPKERDVAEVVLQALALLAKSNAEDS